MNLEDPSGRLTRCRHRLQEFYLRIACKLGKRHADADCLSRCPNEAEEQDDENMAFLGVLDSAIFPRQQRNDAELLPLISYHEGQTNSVRKLFARRLTPYCLRNDVF